MGKGVHGKGTAPARSERGLRQQGRGGGCRRWPPSAPHAPCERLINAASASLASQGQSRPPEGRDACRCCVATDCSVEECRQPRARFPDFAACRRVPVSAPGTPAHMRPLAQRAAACCSRACAAAGDRIEGPLSAQQAGPIYRFAAQLTSMHWEGCCSAYCSVRGPEHAAQRSETLGSAAPRIYSRRSRVPVEHERLGASVR